jgi:hypothetical protein
MSNAAAAVRLEPTPSPTNDVEPEAPKPGLGSPAKLVEMLKQDGGDELQWQRALDCLAAWRHQHHHMRLLDLVKKGSKGNVTALDADEAQVHLDRRWDRLLDVDTLDRATQARGSA